MLYFKTNRFDFEKQMQINFSKKGFENQSVMKTKVSINYFLNFNGTLMRVKVKLFIITMVRYKMIQAADYQINKAKYFRRYKLLYFRALRFVV
jgi:hypothetical protein